MFWLLAKNALRLKIVHESDFTGRNSMGCKLPVESLVNGLLFRDKSNSPLDHKRAEQWDLSNSKIYLDKVDHNISSIGKLSCSASEDLKFPLLDDIQRVLNMNALRTIIIISLPGLATFGYGKLTG